MSQLRNLCKVLLGLIKYNNKGEIKMFKMLCNKKGFSLLELIIVIAILAVISAVAVPAILNTFQDLKIKADISTAQAISKSINLAAVNNKDTKTIDIAKTDTTGVALDKLAAPLQAELAKSYSGVITLKPQSNASGDFTVIISEVNPYKGSVSFSDGIKTYKVDENGVVTSK